MATGGASVGGRGRRSRRRGGRRVDGVGEREEHRLPLLVVDEVGLLVVVAQVHPRDGGRAERVLAGDGAAPGAPTAPRGRASARATPSATSGTAVSRRRRPAGAGAPVRRRPPERRRPGRRSRRGRRRAAGRAASGPAAGAGRPVGHQRGDLVAGQRAPQVAHRPARREHLGHVLAGPRSTNSRLARPLIVSLDRADVDRARRRAHALEQPGLVPLGLQPADHPRAGVGDGLVVEVDGVLGGQHHADAEGPGLLHQRHDRLLGRRVRGGRHVAGHLVHVDERPQVGGAALACAST